MGWYKNSELTNAWNFTVDKVVEDLTLWAKWTINSYTINFNTNGGSSVKSVTAQYNTTIAKPANPTKVGSTFVGWYKNSGLTTLWNFAAKITSTMTLWAKWNVNRYAITFNTNGGSVISQQTVEHDKLVRKPVNPAKKGFTFLGWYKEPSFTTKWNFDNDKVTVNTTLYAQWEAVTGVSKDDFVLKLYPNPATTILNLDNIDITGAALIYFFDVSGRLALQKEVTSVIDISVLPQGIYTVKAGDYTAKIMKR